MFALLFIPKFYHVDEKSLSKLLNDHIVSYKNVGDLSKNKLFSELLQDIGHHLGISTFESQIPVALEINKETQIESNRPKINEFIPLDIDGESLIVIPWILHAVYHGLERATYDMLGEASLLHEQLMERYTVEILDRFHLLDSLMGENTTVVDALKLGIEHLERVGEKIDLTVLGENKFELDINCTFAESVHPHLPRDLAASSKTWPRFHWLYSILAEMYSSSSRFRLRQS